MLRLTCPSAFETSADSASGGGTFAGAAVPKKAFKRPRRRDLPPPAKAPPHATNVDADSRLVAVGSGGGADGKGERVTPPPPPPPGVAVDGGSSGGELLPQTQSQKNRCEEPKAVVAVAMVVPSGEGAVVGASGDDGAGRSDDNQCGGGGGGGMEVIRTGLKNISISKNDSISSSSSSSAVIGPPQGAALPPPAAVPESGATPMEIEGSPPTPTPIPATSPPPAASVKSPGWENMRFSRPKGATSAVSLHATLAAAVASETAAAAATAGPPGVLTVSGSQANCPDNSASLSSKGTTENAAADTSTPSPVPASGKRKTVLFAAGTKEAAPKLSDGAEAALAKTAALTTLGRRKGGGGRTGSGSGAGAGPRGRDGKEKKKERPGPRKSVLGGVVVEREPVVPAPMEAKMGGGGGGGGVGGGGSGGNSARERAGMVEGYSPSIEADLSFRVMPRGYDPYAETEEGMDGGFEEEKIGGEVGLDGGLDEDAESGGGGGEEGKEDSVSDPDENDR